MNYIIGSESLSVFFPEGDSFVIDKTHHKWDDIIQAIKKNAPETVLKLIRTPVTVVETEDIRVENNRVFINGEQLDNSLAQRIVRMQAEGFNTEPIVGFLRNLNLNPDARCFNYAYDFLERNALPLTKEGHFVAYKKLKDDYTDLYTGKISNKVGRTVSIPRHMCDPDPKHTCSRGLHVAGYKFVSNYGGQRLIAVKVNPKNIVSVPIDYDRGKMRVCEYKVVAELTNRQNVDVLAEYSVYKPN